MKSRQKLSLTLLLAAGVLGCGGWAYWQTRAPRPQRINRVSNLKQIGLSFRQGRNDFNERFQLTGQVASIDKPQIRDSTAPR